MKQKKDNNTEEKIIEAAKKIFIKHGMAGARMQAIANEAGINKALLHYYFRSKEKLFTIVFESVTEDFMPRIMEILNGNLPIFDKISIYVSTYLDVLIKKPYLPGFIIHEINSNPKNLIRMFKNKKIDLEPILSKIEKEVKKGNIRPIDPIHLFVNMVSLCVFPVIAKPMVSGIFMQGDDDLYNKFMEERKKQVTDFIINSIKIDK